MWCRSMGKGKPKSKLKEDEVSVRWITSYGECTVLFDDDGDLTVMTSVLPCPVLKADEWLEFCAAVNNRIKLNEKDE